MTVQVPKRLISHRYIWYIDYVLRVQDLGMPAPTGLETVTVYMRWFSSLSHPYIITSSEDVHISRPPEQEALDEIVAEV